MHSKIKVYDARTGEFKRHENEHGKTIVTGTEAYEPPIQPAQVDRKGVLSLLKLVILPNVPRSDLYKMPIKVYEYFPEKGCSPAVAGKIHNKKAVSI